MRQEPRPPVTHMTAEAGSRASAWTGRRNHPPPVGEAVRVLQAHWDLELYLRAAARSAVMSSCLIGRVTVVSSMTKGLTNTWLVTGAALSRRRSSHHLAIIYCV